MTKNEENLQIPNHLMKFSEIWYVHASQQKKYYKKLFFLFRHFFAFFGQKQTILTKNEENCQNPNHLMKFSENEYVRCFSTKENSTKNLSFFWLFSAKNSQN